MPEMEENHKQPLIRYVIYSQTSDVIYLKSRILNMYHDQFKKLTGVRMNSKRTKDVSSQMSHFYIA